MKNYLDDDDDEDEKTDKNLEIADPAQSSGAKAGGASKNTLMDKFFEDVEKAKNAIGRLKGATVQVKALQDEAVSAVGSDAEEQLSEKLARIIVQGNKDAAIAKRVLENIKKETEKLDKKKFHADIRVRENIHATSVANLVTTVKAYQQAQQEYKAKLQEKATRQVRVVKPDATEEEVKAVIQSGDVNQVYREALLEPGVDPIAQVYLNIADKYQDVLKLERSVIELHKMFQDMSVLVSAQGEMLESIEMQVEKTRRYVESGKKSLNAALKARKQTRKCQLCFMCILIIVIAVILGPVLGVFK